MTSTNLPPEQADRGSQTTPPADGSPFARQRLFISRLVVWPLGALVLLTQSAWESRHPWDGVLFFLGCIAAGIATIGRLWCSIYICGRKNAQLVMTGPYSVCRNPLYFFSAIGAVGIGFATETLTAPLLVILIFALAYPAVIRAEERKLAAKHGADYAAYLARTPAFMPRFSLHTEPDTYEVRPAKFRKAMFDALWFVWLLGLLELAEALREAGILPTILHVY